MLAAITVSHVLVGTAIGQQGKDAKVATKKQRSANRSKSLPGVTPEREAAVLTFVKRHHPELIRLLSYLRNNQPRNYQKAIRELARTAERMAQIHERDMKRHDLELRAWKARSRIDVLAAQWQMEPSEQLKTKLRAALVEQADARKQLLMRERERLLERIAKLDSQIEQVDKRQDRDIESRLQTLTKAVHRSDSAKTRGAKTRTHKTPRKSDKAP